MRRGFTLVELSIVLVIIGLLIGGILVAQSMIETAKLQNMISKFQQYEVAVVNFRTNYKSQPGDSALMQPPGNANNELDYNGFSCNSTDGTVSGSEEMQAFVHLTRTNMLKGSFTAYSPSACGGTHSDDVGAMAGISVPTFIEDGELATMVNISYLAISGKNIPIFFRKNSFISDTHAYFQTYIYTSDAVAIDRKLDDGGGWSGDIITFTQMGTNPCEDFVSEKEVCDIAWILDNN